MECNRKVIALRTVCGGGRWRGSESTAEDFALTMRVDYQGIDGLLVGMSGYTGKSGQDKFHGSQTNMWDAHLEYIYKGIYAKALYTWAQVADTLEASYLAGGTYNSATFACSPVPANSEAIVGSKLYGFYTELGYDIFRFFESTHQFIAFARYEQVDTQWRRADGTSRNKEAKRDIITIGFSYKPIFQIVVKADYEIVGNAAETGRNQLNFGVGYLFIIELSA